MAHPLTIRLNEADIAKLDEIAKATDRKRSWHMARAIHSYIEDEYTFLEGVRRGVEAADRGEVVAHETVAFFSHIEYLLARTPSGDLGSGPINLIHLVYERSPKTRKLLA